MNRKDFIDWKQHPVTQQVFRQLQENANGLKEMLSVSAGINPREDSKMVGAIMAFQDILNIEYEGEEQE